MSVTFPTNPRKTTLPGQPRDSHPPPARPGGPVRRDQLLCAAVIVILLALIFALQPTLNRRRAKLVYSSQQGIGNLFLEFPRLTLGGFRGILAMVLWENAESDKNHRRWIPLETDYNAIATLEPYFGSVYIYNAWNQSYNLSAQFHSMSAKYKWVLDGLVYLYKGEKFVPHNANMIMNEANDFFLKLGTSFERRYYCARWRYDIAHLYMYNQKSVNPALSTLAEVRYIVRRPEFKASLLPARNGKGPPGHGLKINSRTYRYGISPFYFAWVEYRRALAQPQKPTDMGREVLNSWPPMALRLWCRDDLYFAQRLTYRIFSQPQAKMLRRFPARAENIRDCYRNVRINAPRSIREFQIYLHKFPNQIPVHRQHVYEVRFYEALGRAESRLFQGLLRWQVDHRRFRLGDAADRDLAAATGLYEKAIAAYRRYLALAYPPQLNGMPNSALHRQIRYLRAMRARIRGIDNFRRTAAHHAPNLDFLAPQTLSYND